MGRPTGDKGPGETDAREGRWLGGGVSPSSPCPPPPGAVRSFGSAKARYDFCARDRTELTLREGDVIRVLSKKGHPGWWKGEIYGRVRPLEPPRTPPRDPSEVLTPPLLMSLLPQVGWFPANYVEEDYSEYC